MVTSPFRAKLLGLFHSLSEQSFPLIRPRCCQGCWGKAAVQWDLKGAGSHGATKGCGPLISPFAMGDGGV